MNTINATVQWAAREKLCKMVADYLGEVGTGVIEDALRKTKAFKDWVKSR